MVRERTLKRIFIPMTVQMPFSRWQDWTIYCAREQALREPCYELLRLSFFILEKPTQEWCIRKPGACHRILRVPTLLCSMVYLFRDQMRYRLVHCQADATEEISVWLSLHQCCLTAAQQRCHWPQCLMLRVDTDVYIKENGHLSIH